MWNRLTRRTGVAVWLLVFGTSVAAQPDPAADGPTLNLNQAVARTLARNPALLAFGHQLQAQDGRVLQAGLAPNPELNVMVENVLGGGRFSGVDGAESTLSIAWILERGVRQRRVESARAGASLLAVEADIVRLDAAAETARWFFANLSAQARRVNAREAVRLARQTVQAVQRRVAAGKAPQAELARAHAEVARLELQQEEIGHEWLSARRQLAAQWGQSEPQFTRVAGDLMALPRIASFEDLRVRLDENPDLARFLSRQRVDEAELRLARAQSKPNSRVSAGLRRFEISDDEALVANITLPLAIRNRNQGRIAEARAGVAQTQAEPSPARWRPSWRLSRRACRRGLPPRRSTTVPLWSTRPWRRWRRT